VRVFNAVNPRSNCADPVPDVLRSCLGSRADQLDLSWHENPDHAFDALYATDNIQRALGFASDEPTRATGESRSEDPVS